MKNKIKIEVTQDDIVNGRPGRANSCPIARAINRQLKPSLLDRFFGGEWTASVGNRDAIMGLYRFSLPPEASEFIYNFDTAQDVHPFTFEMTKK